MTTWLFDLDDTLHHASRHAFPVINRAMTQYLMGRLGLTHSEASSLRQHYWRRYGATLLGLIRHHPHIDPHHFLFETHPLDELTESIHPMRGLRRTLLRLKGQKILFTNAPRAYAETLLAELGVSDCFDAVFGVEDARLKPKPDVNTYRQLLRLLRADPRRCVMVEDSSCNLAPAKKLGIKTVWLRRSARRSLAADVLIRRLDELPLRFR